MDFLIESSIFTDGGIKLAKLLEADITLKSRKATPSNAVQSFDQQATGRLVTYDVFLRSYWPHFSQSLTKGLGIPFLASFLSSSKKIFFADPSLVFCELIGEA